MQIDVTVNMTYEVEKAEWESFKEDSLEAGLDDEDTILEEFVRDSLEGEEVLTHMGRAWVCSVDDCSILNP